MKEKIIEFVVSKSAGWYIARAHGASIFTQAKTLDKLKKNIDEAAGLYLESIGLGKSSKKPKVLLNFTFTPRYVKA